MTAYDDLRAINIQRNLELLQALDISKPDIEPKQVTRRKKTTGTRKRKAPAPSSDGTPSDEEGDTEARTTKVPRVTETDENSGGPRRSARNAGKKVDYEKTRVVEPLYVKKRREADPELGPAGREDGRRIHDPKTFGYIPGIEVGTWWEGRKGCSVDAVHAPLVAGISGGPKGAYSVALSGGYEDDVDLGYAFTYTGSGGRDLKGTKAKPKNLRTAPQSSDQTFENAFNKALQISAKTKKPVRVIRGFKLHSRYAPTEGYRYDGLYTVERAWQERGLNPHGYLVCKFALKRLPGQPPLPVQYLEGEEPEQGRENAETEEEEAATEEAEGEEVTAEEAEAEDAEEKDG